MTVLSTLNCLETDDMIIDPDQGRWAKRAWKRVDIDAADACVCIVKRDMKVEINNIDYCECSCLMVQCTCHV